MRATGNWTPAQNVQHVTKFITASIDGTDVRAALPMRLLGRLLRRSALRKPLSPGFRLPQSMRSFEPDPEVTWDDAVGALQREIDRLNRGARMAQPSPFFGALSHEQWEQLHCRHAELHFSFLHAG